MRGYLCVALFTTAVLTGAAEVAAGEKANPEETARSTRRLRLFPGDELYPRYLADPHAPATGVVLQFFSSTEIEQAGDRRQQVKLGGSFPLLRLREKRPGGRRWQLRLDGGIDAQFDPSNQTDNTGWDGNYGLMLTTDRDGGGLAARIGIFHISAHLGDEWILRTGRERIGYRREELLGGLAWTWGGGRRFYVEGGWAFDTLSPLQREGRAQAGFEHEARAGWFGPSIRWYGAVDLSAWEERDWRLDTGAQIGIVMRPHGRAWRFGLQYWDGRVPLGEFFLETEANVSIGLWTDL